MKKSEREFEDHGLRADGIHLNPVPRLHSHSELELNWVEVGWIEYTTMSGLKRLEVDQPYCFWGAFPHQIMAMSDDMVGYWITVPHQVWLSWELQADLKRDLLSGAFRRLEGVSSAHLQSWLKEVMSASSNHHHRRAMFLEMEACLLRSGSRHSSAHDLEANRAYGHGEARQRHATNLVRAITDRYLDDINIGGLAEEAGITPEYATSVFGEVMGISLKSYLTHLRVAHAQSLLIATSDSITEIGFESGFKTLSRFYAAFKGSCGMTPKSYRQKHRAR